MRCVCILSQQILVRRATKPTLLVGDVFPAGTEVGMPPWLLNFDKNIIGEDAEEWRLERWADDEQAKRMERVSLNWGMGSRNCLGKGIALLEGEKFVPELIRRYNCELEDGLRKKAEERDRWDTKARTFVKMVGLKVKVKRREKI